MDEKELVKQRVDTVAAQLTDLADRIFQNPEYCFQ